MLRRADDLLSGPLPRVRPYPALLPAVRDRQAGRPHLWALLAVTLFAAGLRFYRLTWPPLWNDETLVFWRVCGTYGQMLGPLKTDGFPPLHYSLYWLLGHPVPVGADVIRPFVGLLVTAGLLVLSGVGSALAFRRERSPWERFGWPAAVTAFAGLALLGLATVFGVGWMVPPWLVPGEHTLKLTPWVMRSVPAICGTLTVPAMYFLARQLLDRWAAVTAAAVTCCSAFMLFYSRDAKMYPDAWLLIVLNVGCLLWWFRTGSSTAYLAWVAAGCGAVGLHPSAYAVPALSTVFLLTQRQLRWPRAVLFVVGLGVIYSGIAVYFTKFNLWNERVDTIGWQASGLGWVGGFYNGNRTGPEHLGYATTAFLAGYEWPRDDYLWRIAPSLQEVPQALSLEVIGVLAVCLLPWPLVRAVVRPARQAARDAAAPEPPWRVWLWLGTWIVVPTYALYCRSTDSIHGFVGPLRWTWELWDATPPVAWAAVGAAAVAFAAAAAWWPAARPMFGRTVRFWLVTAALFGACQGLFVFLFDGAANAAWIGRPWQSLWEPRYLGFMWPAVGVGVAALLMRLPTRAVRVAAITAFCGCNLFVFGMRMRLWTEPPIDRLAADVWAAQDVGGRPSTVRTYDYIERGGIAVAQTNLGVYEPKVEGGRYFLQMLSDRRPMSPQLFEWSLSGRVSHPYTLREGTAESAVQYDLRHAPQVDRVIVWTQLNPESRDELTTNSVYGEALPPDRWRLVGEDVYPVRVIWDWREYWKWVRREYVRVGAEGARRVGGGA